MALVILINGHREKYNPTPGQTLGQFLEQACLKHRVDFNNYNLM